MTLCKRCMLRRWWSVDGNKLWQFYMLIGIILVRISKCELLSTTPANVSNLANEYNNNNDIQSVLAQEGCANYKDAHIVAPSVVACRGSWQGHVSNAGHLCSNGFTLCTWQDESHLKEIRWSTATQMEGCFAINAAQDGNKCIPCKADLGSDDLAAIGKYCPHVNFGQSACLEEGRIDASCCLDTLKNRACGYIPNLISGVLCCKRNVVVNDRPYFVETILTPPVHVVHSVGERVTLKCSLVSLLQQNQQVVWLKDEHIMPHVHTPSFLIPFARVEDSAIYACRSGSSTSIATTYINLTITEVPNNACADDTSDGFHDAQNVVACAGSWKGHIKRADKQLCGKGWRVCIPKDRPFINQIDLTYITDFGGCFAYNAAHIKHKCRRCQNKRSMAALGRDCSVNEKFVVNVKRRQRHSCYSSRIVQAYSDKYVKQHGGGGCMFRKDNGITGVLCCRKPRRKKVALKLTPSKNQPQWEISLGCYPECRNGGTCLDGQCLCPKGYFGHACQHGGCNPRCLNGGLCLYGFCKCDIPFYGLICQNNLPIEANENCTEDSSIHNRISDVLG